MPTQGILVEELSQIISEATAPAFLLGAVAALISILIGRLNRVLDRCRKLVADREDPPPGRQETLISTLRRRAKLLGKALECAIITGIMVTFLVITAFASAAIGLNQVYGAAILFVIALGFFAGSLICLWADVRIAVRDLDQIH